jgi:hypothetical protein
MLIISKGKGASSKSRYNTDKLTPVERLESLHEKNYSYNPDVGREGMKSYDLQNNEMYKEAKRAEK